MFLGLCNQITLTVSPVFDFSDTLTEESMTGYASEQIINPMYIITCIILILLYKSYTQ